MDGCSRRGVGVGYLKVPRPTYQLILTVVSRSGPQLTSLVTSPVTPEIAMPYVCRCSVETVWLCQALGVECPSAYTDLLSPISADVPSPLLSLLNMKRFEIQAIVGKIPRLLCQLRLLYKDFRPSRGHWHISMVWMSDWVCTWRLVRTLFTFWSRAWTKLFKWLR